MRIPDVVCNSSKTGRNKTIPNYEFGKVFTSENNTQLQPQQIIHHPLNFFYSVCKSTNIEELFQQNSEPIVYGITINTLYACHFQQRRPFLNRTRSTKINQIITQIFSLYPFIQPNCQQSVLLYFPVFLLTYKIY